MLKCVPSKIYIKLIHFRQVPNSLRGCILVAKQNYESGDIVLQYFYQNLTWREAKRTNQNRQLCEPERMLIDGLGHEKDSKRNTTDIYWNKGISVYISFVINWKTWNMLMIYAYYRKKIVKYTDKLKTWQNKQKIWVEIYIKIDEN